MSVLEQGDVIRVDFTPSVGHEPAKVRPAVVASVYAFNAKSSLVMLIPITRTDSGYPMHIRVKGCGAIQGFACIEQMQALDIQQRGFELLGSVDDRTLRSIMSRLRGIFALR